MMSKRKKELKSGTWFIGNWFSHLGL